MTTTSGVTNSKGGGGGGSHSGRLVVLNDNVLSIEKQIFRETNLNFDLYYRLYIYHR